jgi:hypothetical protein
LVTRSSLCNQPRSLTILLPIVWILIGLPYLLKLADLPERLQLRIIEAGIDRIRFAESEVVQPLEHTPCDAWGNTDYWIDTQGVEHTPASKLRNTWNSVNQTWIDEDGVEY